MGKIFKYFVYALLFSPLIGYFTYTYYDYQAVQFLEYTVIVLFTIFIVTRNKTIYIPKFLYFYFCYIIYIFIWRLYNGYVEEKGFVKYIFNNFHLYTALLIIVIYNIKIDKSDFDKTLTLIKIVLIIALVGVLLQLLIDPNLFVRPYGWDADEGSIYLSRRPSVFTWVSDNEYGISILAYFSLILSFDSIDKKNLRLILFLILIGIYSILTNGRYIMIGYVLVITQLLIKQRLKIILKYFIFISLAIFIGYYIYTDVLNFNIKELAEKRLFAEGAIKNTSRYLAFELFIKYFPENPFFGASQQLAVEITREANQGGSSQVHVGYFAHMVSYGLVGSFFLFTFWGLLARDLYNKAKQTGFYGAFFAFLVFLWANAAMVDYNIFYPGVLIALIYSEYYYSNFLQTKYRKQKDLEVMFQQKEVLKSY